MTMISLLSKYLHFNNKAYTTKGRKIVFFLFFQKFDKIKCNYTKNVLFLQKKDILQMKKLSKKQNILIAVCCVVALLFVAVMEYYFGHNPNNWSKISTNVFSIPDLAEGFVPQGLCYDDIQDVYFVSGYMKNKTASRIYMIDLNSNQKKYVTISCQNNEFEVGHFGGISAHGEYLFVASDGYILTINMIDIANAKNKTEVDVQNLMKTFTGADFCFAQTDGLWVGEFYRKNKYETDTTHHVKISDLETNHSVALFFPYDNLSQSGLSNPTKAISLPDQVQGMSILDDGRIVLSTSWSLADSKIFVYKNTLSLPDQTITIDQSTLTLQILCKNDLQKTITAPCMAEGIVCKDGTIQILFESACNKYKFVTRNRIKHVQSINID